MSIATTVVFSLLAIHVGALSVSDTLTMTMLFASKDIRDRAVSTGMTDGMEIGYARLDDMFKQAA